MINPVYFSLGFSWVLFFSYSFTSAAAAVALFYAGLPLLLKCALFVGLSLYSIYLFRQVVFVKSKLLFEGGDFYLMRSLVEKEKITVCGSTIVTRYFIYLRYRLENERLPKTILILRDCLDKKSFRQLIVSLRYGNLT